MIVRSFFALAALLYCAALRIVAEDLPSVLAEGAPLLPEKPRWSLAMSNGIATIITYDRPAVTPGPIVQSKTVALQTELWRTLASTLVTNRAFAAGDVLLMTFRARCTETTNTTGMGVLHAHFELAERPYPKMHSVRFNIAKEWTRFWMPFRLKRDIPLNMGKMIFNLGFAIQMIELCDVQFYSFPAGFDIGRLPKTEPAGANP